MQKQLGLRWGVSISGGLLWCVVMPPSNLLAAPAATSDSDSPPSLAQASMSAQSLTGTVAANSGTGRLDAIALSSPERFSPDFAPALSTAIAISPPSEIQRSAKGSVQPVAMPEVAASPVPPIPIAQTPDPSQVRPDPNRDRLIQPTPPTPAPPPEPLRPVLPPTPQTPNPTPDLTVPVSRIEVVGSTVFGAKEFDPIVKPLQGRSVTLEELRQAADAITQLYLNQGYITSRAILADQTITNGVVRIQIVEGALEGIKVEGAQRVRESYIRSRIGLGAQTPLNRDRLENQLRLLKTDPLFTNVEASLRSGTELGKSLLLVRVTEANPWQAFLSFDNYSPPSVGSLRFGAGVGYRNLTGNGDQIFASYFRSTTGGSSVADFSYQIPLNPMNGTLQLRISPSFTRITDGDFAALDIKGNSQLYEVNFRQPLIRTPRREFALSVGFSAQNGQTFLFSDQGFPFGIGPDADGNSRTRVFKFGQDYILRDPQGAWAFRSLFNFGVDIWGATRNSGSIPDGRFFSWLGQIQRVQRLGDRHLLIVQGDLQLTPDPLLPSQQFVIGGGQSIRGYRQNFRSGDNGFRISVEDRIALIRDAAGVPTLQLAPFFDFGSVWNVSGNPNLQPSGRFLAGLGTGILWQPIPRLNLRVDLTIPLLRRSDRGDDIQDKGIYFSLGYQF